MNLKEKAIFSDTYVYQSFPTNVMTNFPSFLFYYVAQWSDKVRNVSILQIRYVSENKFQLFIRLSIVKDFPKHATIV